MNFEDFIKICVVQNCGEFWAVHINSTKVKHPKEVNVHLQSISIANPGCAVMWVTPNGNTVWMTDGKNKSKWGPALIESHPTVHMFDGFDPVKAYEFLRIGPSSSLMEIEYTPGRNMVIDEPTHIVRRGGARIQWRHAGKPKEYNHPGWDALIRTIPDGADVIRHTVTSESYIQKSDSAGITYNRMNSDEHTVETGSSVYRYGTIDPDGTLVSITLYEKKSFMWRTKTQKDGVIHHRDDGPSTVNLFNHRELKRGNRTSVMTLGGYSHEWHWKGKWIIASDVSEKLSNAGIIIRSGPLHEQSAFLNEQDHAIWMGMNH